MGVINMRENDNNDIKFRYKIKFRLNNEINELIKYHNNKLMDDIENLIEIYFDKQ